MPDQPGADGQLEGLPGRTARGHYAAGVSVTSGGAAPAPVSRSRTSRGLVRLTLGAELAAASALAGILAGALAGRLGPVVLVAAPVLALAVALTFRNIELAPALLVAALPVGLVVLPGGYQLVQVVGALVVGLVVLRRLAAGEAPLVFPPVLWWGVGVALAAALGTSRAVNLDAALRQDVTIVLALLVVCAVASACRSLTDVRRLAALIAGIGLVVSAIGLRGISSLQAINNGQTVNNRARGTFTEPNQFGTFSATVLIVCVGLYLAAKTRPQRWGAAVCGMAALTALGFTLSRGAWIGTALAVALLLVLLPAARRGLVALAVPLLAIGLALGAAQPDRPELQAVRERVTTFGNPAGNPYDQRPEIWAEARRQVAQRPLLGQGPGQFPYVTVRSAGEASLFVPQHAHDVLLTVAAELGLPAAGMVVGFTLSMLALVRRALARLPDLRDRALLAGLASSLAVVVGQGIVDFELRNAVVLALLCLVTGAFLAASRIALGVAPHQSGPAPG